jgi:hypothetical protein
MIVNAATKANVNAVQSTEPITTSNMSFISLLLLHHSTTSREEFPRGKYVLLNKVGCSNLRSRLLGIARLLVILYYSLLHLSSLF